MYLLSYVCEVYFVIIKNKKKNVLYSINYLSSEQQDNVKALNPYLTNGFSHHYQLGESTFIFRDVRSDFYFLSHFLMKFLQANRIAPDGTPRSAASHLGLCCLPMSHKKDTRVK